MQSYEYHAYHSHPAMQEYHALSAQIEAGYPMHPREVQDVIDELIEAGYHFQAAMLAKMEVNWDR